MVAGPARVVLLACVIGLLLCSATVGAQSEADRDRAKAGVVMLKSKLPTGDAFGAGIVVAVTAQDAYVVTANHVLRLNGTATSVQVQFNARPGEWFDGRILDLMDRDLDIGAVAVRLPPSVTAASLKGLGAVSSSLQRGSDVYALGYPAAKAWDLPVIADKVASSNTLRLIFQSQYVRGGNSGGALLDACGRIVGMVVLSEPPDAEAVRIESVLDLVGRWSLPSRTLSVQPASPCGAAAASAPAAPAAITPAAPAVARSSTVDEVRRLHEQEKWADSLPLLNRLVAEQPSSAEVFALRSHAYTHLERTTEAIADGEQAVNLGPRLGEAYLRRGEAKSEAGKNSEALADFDRALQFSPNEYEAFVNRGGVYLATGENQKAVDTASQALRIRTDRHQAWAIRGIAYGRLNNHKAAISDLTQAINLRSSDPWFFANRANSYVATQQLELALSDANQALRLKPDDADLLFTRGAVYAGLNRLDSAKEDLTFALRLRPGIKEATDLLAAIDKRAPGPAPAPPIQPPAPAIGGGDSVAYARLLDQTVSAYQGNRIAEAGVLVDQMITLDASRPEGWSLKGAQMIDVNNFAGASEAYQNALERGGRVFFRLAHDHGGSLPPCIGNLMLTPDGAVFSGENGGHQLQMPLRDITEVAVNPYYGVLLGMMHIKTQVGRSNNTYNFAVVHVGDPQVLNRRPEAEVLVGLINRNRLTQSIPR